MSIKPTTIFQEHLYHEYNVTTTYLLRKQGLQLLLVKEAISICICDTRNAN